MTLAEYKQEIKIQLILRLKNFSETDIDIGIKNNEDFISACFNLEYSVNHVVHELTI